MDLMVLDSKYNAIAVVDAFKSAIWTVRFNSAGDFELYLPASKKNLEVFKKDRYLWRRDSERLMIIDTLEISTNTDEVPMLTVTGDSLESILARRVIANYTTINGNLQDAIKKLIDESIINPSLSARKIPNFIFKTSSDPSITKLTVKDLYFQGETVYDAVMSLCEENRIGFRVLPYGAGGFQFELYAGVDRSYDQDVNQYVVFSPKFENLLNSRYVDSYASYKNSCYSIGTWREEVSTGENSTDSVERSVSVWTSRDGSEPQGLARREIFLDNNSLDSDEDEESAGKNQSHWESVAKSKGKEELEDYKVTTAIDGELHGEWQWEYGKDYFLGDKVQVINEFEAESTSYISEIVFSADDTGERIIPTFTSTDPNVDNIS